MATTTTTTSQATNAYVQAAAKLSSDLATMMPNGSFAQEYYRDVAKNPLLVFKAGLDFWKNVFSGRTYRSGQYQLLEIFLRNIIGMEQVQTWRDAASIGDQYYPIARQFLSLCIGVPLDSADDWNALATGNGSTYLDRDSREGLRSKISQAQADRAAVIANTINGGNKNRDAKWPLSWFAAAPYIDPMYTVTGDMPGGIEPFTGIHPVSGKQYTNGYPNAVSTGTSLSTATGTVSKVTASLSSGFGIVLIIGLIISVIVMFAKGKTAINLNP